jgi:arginyl-tRNA synthetase
MAFPDDTRIDWTHLTTLVSYARKPEFGHFQTNCAMILSKLIGQPPRQIAESIVSTLTVDENFTHFYMDPQIAGPGFINFTIKNERLVEMLYHRLKCPRLGVPYYWEVL